MITEHNLVLDVAPGVRLEGLAEVPPQATGGVVVCHPHPLYGGDMHNQVVARLTASIVAAGLGALRFNFRGVGASTGVHDGGRGERDDVRAAARAMAALLPRDAAVALAGYSFGATVAAGCVTPGTAGLALVAPPLAFGGLRIEDLAALRCPVLVVAGDADAYCPPDSLAELAQRLPGAALEVLPGTDHFFLGPALEQLGALVERWARLLGRS